MMTPALEPLARHHRVARRDLAPDLVVVDGSFYLPAMKRDAAGRISRRPYPGRGAFRHRRDRRPCASRCRTCCHGAEQFAREVGALGIADTDTIVVYDGVRLVLRAAGVVDVPAVRRARTCSSSKAGCRSGRPKGRPLESRRGASARRASSARASRPTSSPTLRDVQAALARQHRAGGRRAARRPLPRRGAGAAAGRALRPHPRLAQRAVHRSWSMNGRLLPPDKLKPAFAAGGVDIDQADHHELRLRRLGRHALARARRARQGTEGALRRFMVGMGRARRPSDRARTRSPEPKS